MSFAENARYEIDPVVGVVPVCSRMDRVAMDAEFLIVALHH